MSGGRVPLRRDWPATLLLSLGVAALVYHEALLTTRVFFERDITLLWYPRIASLVRALGQGALPLWDPFPAFGVSAVADANYQLFYPPAWLALLLPAASALKLLIIGHAAWTALGMLLLARRLGLSACAAGLAAILWMAGGPWQSLVSLVNHLSGASWMPWVVLAFSRVLETGSARAAVLLAGATGGQLLAGSADMCLLTLVIAPCCTAAQLARQGLGWSWARRRIALLVGAGLLTLALAAAQWLPTLLQLPHTSRANWDRQPGLYWSLHPIALAELLAPRIVAGLPLRADLRTEIFQGREPFLSSLYLGAAAWPLVIAGFWGRRRRVWWAWAGGFLFSLVMALGRHAPLFPALLHVPGLALFRYPVKWMVPAGLLWALLAALGAEALLKGDEREARRARRAAASAAGLLVLTSLGVASWIALHPDSIRALLAPVPEAAGREALAGLLRGLGTVVVWSLLVVALLVARAGWSGRLGGARRVALVGIVGLDTFLAGSQVNPLAPNELLTQRPPVLGKIEGDAAGFRLYSSAPLDWSPARELAHGPKGWRPEWAWYLGKIEALRPETQGRWGCYGSLSGDPIGLLDPAFSALARAAARIEGPERLLRLLQLVNVRYVISTPDPRLALLEPAGVFASVPAEPLGLWRVPDPQPRAYVVDQARAGTSLDALQTLLDPAFDPRREIVVEDPQAARAGAPAFSGAARTVDRRADRVRVETRSSAPAYLVLVDAFDPGWTAEVDGRPTPILRANLVARAVTLPAGEHRVTFRYRPRAAVWGMGLSLVGLVAAAGLLVATRSSARTGPVEVRP